MKQLLTYVVMLTFAVFLLAGCEGGASFEERDRDYDHGYHDRDWHGNDYGHYNDNGYWRENYIPGTPRDNGNGKPDDHNSPAKDNGEDTITAFVTQHKVPVTITNMEQLPNLTATGAQGTTAQPIERYKVSAKSTGLLKVKVVRIVDYNPATGELALEPKR